MPSIILQARSTGITLVTTKTGTPFHAANFRKDVWEKALKASGVTEKVPYSLRHSFAAWSLTLCIDMNKLVRLMGHGSKKMVYEVYGDYIEGLEQNAWKILEYFGRDFIETKGQRPRNLLGYASSTDTVAPGSFLRLDHPTGDQTENPYPHYSSLSESFGESRGHIPRISNDSI